VEEKNNKMSHLEEKGARKAPIHNNAGNITVAAHQRAHTAKGRPTPKPGMAAL
jgi:hypothetical protein